MSSDVGASNRQAAECLRMIERFVDELRIDGQMIFDFGSEPPFTYTAARDRAKQILNDGASFLSNTTDEPHFGAPIINPYVEPILKYEKDQLERIVNKIGEAHSTINVGDPNDKPGRLRRFWNWISRGFNSADTIIDSLKSHVPGLSFVGEFEKQLGNLLRREPL